MGAVAEHAVASKATIYHWWPSKELLALDALFSEWQPARSDAHDTGSRRPPLRPFYHRILHGHAKPTDRFARGVVDYVAAAVSRPAE